MQYKNPTGHFLSTASCVLAALFVVSGFSACKFNPNLQGRGTEFLQGSWMQDKVPYQDRLLEYTRHQYVFTCDSFYATFHTSAKYNRYEENCFNNGQWDEYAKGVYQVKGDTLFLNGTFTRENWRQKITGCYRIGQYLEGFIIKKHTPDLLILQSLQDHLALTLSLKQKITCQPKPIE